MRRASSVLVLSVFSLAFVLCCSIVSLAQTRDKFVISAKAGGINAITGQATVHARGEADWHQLMITDDLNSGDRIRTAYDGRVEILLNPGSYLRLGGNSEVELSDNSLANLELRLLRGTAIVEATGADGIELNINISTPHTKLAIVRQGLYRVSVLPGDATELIVRKGRVLLGDSHTKVKGGNKVVFNAINVSVAKLTKEEKKKQEEVDVWSKERAETLAKANRRITDRMLRTAFASYRVYDPFWGSRSGLWFYNSRAGCYTFLPFFYGWGSPYGSSYSTSVYAGYSSGWGSWPRNGSGGQSQSGGSSGAGATGGTRSTPPPQAPSAPSRPTGIDRPSPRIDSDGTRILRKNMERMPN